jgi:riboflavin transporter FmnP
MKSSNTRKLVMAALCVALGLVLPITFHAIPNAGSIFLPMHIPVLLCGFIAGWPFGLLCGIVTPLLSSVFTGMPPMSLLPGMLCELAVYGVVSGLLYARLNAGNRVANLYLSLIPAMLAGRVVSGILNATLFSVGRYSMHIWLTASFVTALPGIVIQLVVIPVLVAVLQKAKLVETPHLQHAQ